MDDRNQPPPPDAYEAFFEKFKPKKTTDDCYTPPLVYDAVLQWVRDTYQIDDGVEIVRPFWPGGDFEAFDYPPGCIVVDNPPFSISAKIKRFYVERGIKFFLFQPALTLFSADRPGVSYVLINQSVTFENGAVVQISFATNLATDGTFIRIASDLDRLVKAANKANLKKQTKKPPKYDIPSNVITSARLQRLCQSGESLLIPRREVSNRISALDSQREAKKALFGGGFLVSDRVAGEIERLQAEATKRIQAEATKRIQAEATKRIQAEDYYAWHLTPREQDIIKQLNH